MKFGILVAMEEEIKKIIQELENYKIVEIAKQKFYEGFIKEKKVFVVQSGIGKVNATIASSILIEKFGVDFVINTGSAGAIKEGIKIGDLVISEKLAYHDVDNRVFDYEYGQIPQMPRFYHSDANLNKKMKKIAKENKWAIHNGLIVSGDSFVSSKNQIKAIKKHFPNAIVTEMEGAAVAQTCYQFDIPYLIIRAVSDSSDEEASINFDEFVLSAGKKSAELVLALIKAYK